jgi:type IV fimbrial biogenesis protein FimT
VQGFTLIELIVAATIMAILMAIATPAMTSLMTKSRLTSYANTLVANAIKARSEAIKRNSTVTMCVSTDGATCTTGGWQQGWVILAGTTVLQRQQAAASGMKITESNSKTSLTFDPSGVGTTSATLTVCSSSPLGSEERVVTITSTGHAYVKKTTTGICT